MVFRKANRGEPSWSRLIGLLADRSPVPGCSDSDTTNPGRIVTTLAIRAFYFFVKPDSLRFVGILVGRAGHVPVRSH